jgi:putative phosphoribosyl transferase
VTFGPVAPGGDSIEMGVYVERTPTIERGSDRTWIGSNVDRGCSGRRNEGEMMADATIRFRDRRHAGRRLAAVLGDLGGTPRLVIAGLPRGGVPVADEVAKATAAPLDVILVRKLGVPYQPELAFGAIGEDGVQVLNANVVAMAHLAPHAIDQVAERERAELERRSVRFRAGRRRIPLAGSTVVIVDDGIATGATARAACQVARAEGAERVIVAVPVAPPGWDALLTEVADELIAIETPSNFAAVGQFYDDFSQCTDDEVVAILAAADAR